jgi:hypothetical protein
MGTRASSPHCDLRLVRRAPTRHCDLQFVNGSRNPLIHEWCVDRVFACVSQIGGMMKKHSYLVIFSVFLFGAACGSEAENANDTCVSSSSSFARFSSTCELAEVSCGGGQLLTHQGSTTAQKGDVIVTTHKFLDTDGASVELVEECGGVCSGGESLSAGGCRLEGMIQGEAFVVFDVDVKSPYPGYLLEVFRTDLVAGTVTNSFGDPTNFTDLADVQVRWENMSGAFASVCSVPDDWCTDDFAIYDQ